jgi:hypothetical protein
MNLILKVYWSHQIHQCMFVQTIFLTIDKSLLLFFNFSSTRSNILSNISKSIYAYKTTTWENLYICCWQIDFFWKCWTGTKSQAHGKGQFLHARISTAPNISEKYNFTNFLLLSTRHIWCRLFLSLHYETKNKHSQHNLCMNFLQFLFFDLHFLLCFSTSAFNFLYFSVLYTNTYVIPGWNMENIYYKIL